MSVVNDDRYPVLTKLISDVNELYDRVIDIDRGEGGRILAEDERKSSEILRKSNEEIRVSNENNREGRLSNLETSLETITRLITEFGAKGDGVTDDTIAFKNALRVAYDTGGIRLRVPKGNYVVDGFADIYSNTHIELDKEARIIKTSNSTTDYLFVCGRVDVEGTQGYGGGAKNVTIIGGEFVGIPGIDRGISFTLNHGQNFVFKDITFTNCVCSGHVFDLAGCDDITIDKCIFRGRTVVTNREFTEAIQIDNSTETALSGNFSNYDNLPTKNVVIKNCRFIPIYNTDNTIKYYAPNPVGSHSFVPNMYFENIKFIDNYVENANKREGSNTGGWLRFYSVKGLEIKNNIFKNTKGLNSYCISLQSKSVNDVYNICENVKIENNTIYGFNSSETSNVYSPIRIYGADVCIFNNIKINNNTITECYNDSFGKNTDNGSNLIHIDYANNVEILNNICDKTKRFAHITTSNNIEIKGNKITNCFYVPIGIFDSNSINISNNFFNNCNNVVYMNSCNYLSIVGNEAINTTDYIIGTYASVIAINLGSNGIISDNRIINTNSLNGFTYIIQLYGSGSKNYVVKNNIISGYTTNITSTTNSTIFIDDITNTNFI